MTLGRIGAIVLLLTGFAGSLLPGAAGATPPFGQPLVAEPASAMISRDEAAAIAQARTGGRVLSVDLKRNGRPWYRVKLLISGERVRTVSVDAKTGEVRD
jgi:uncharacterized membrane protein YkoI